MRNDCIYRNIDIDGWVNGCKVRVFPWVDGEHIYCNVQYYRPLQSMWKPPVWDRSVLIDDTEAGRRFVCDYLDTLVKIVGNMRLVKEHMGHIVVGTDGSIAVSCTSEALKDSRKPQGKAAEKSSLCIYVLERDNPDYTPKPLVFSDKQQAFNVMLSDYADTKRMLGITTKEGNGYDCETMLSEKDGNGSILIQSHHNSDRYQWRLTAHDVPVA